MSSLFRKSIRYLSGVGEKRTEQFNRLGVFDIGSLLLMYPKSYEDWSKFYSVSSCPINTNCCVRGLVSSPVKKSFIRKNMILYKLNIKDEFSQIELVFFNNPYVCKALEEGKEYIFYGKVIDRGYSKEMISPKFKRISDACNFNPIYVSTDGLNSKKIESCVKAAIRLLPESVNDPIPEDIRKQYNLVDLKQAIIDIHFPKTKYDLEKARRRLVFEELLILQLGLLFLKNKKNVQNTIKIEKNYTDEFEKLLKFELTDSQKKSIDECMNDMIYKKSSMNRLLQGDVGSGKTAVAAAVSYNAFRNSVQTALMVPTEILAEQHYNWFCKVFDGTGARIALLTSSTRQSQKKKIKESLQYGGVDIVIGTHALLTGDVEFLSLGLVITDEQHRFGVAQRSKLASKGKSPHMLIMSATPIPRTLGLIMYSDLDISVLDEVPKGRQKIDTFLIDAKKRDRALNFIKDQIKEGRQAYIVCPLVEENENSLMSAEKYYETLCNGIFKDISVGLIHGKMHPFEKQKIMEDFVDQKISLLVSTTVIEVGIDNPNSTVIMIENAERFGLSQLHQLRGRVGRGDHKSYCIMVSNSQNEETLKRFKILTKTNNGFEIADEDLKIRGPGDFFGQKQHGLPELKIANMLSDIDILKEAQSLSSKITKLDPLLESEKFRIMKSEVDRLFSNVGENGLN